MSNIVQDMSEQALIPAMEANFAEEVAAFGRYLPGAEFHEDAEMQWFITGLPSSLFNAVLRTSMTSDTPSDIKAKIEEMLAYFRPRCVSMAWGVGPSTRPADLATHLLACSFILVHVGTGMAANLHALHEDNVTPGNFRIEEVSNQEMLKQYFVASMRGFGSSEEHIKVYYDTYTNIGFGKHVSWRHYLGLLDNEPVAASSLLLHAGVAGVYGVTTVPEARRRGIGTAMTITPLREARGRGYRVGVLTPTELSLNIYHRLGFREYCTINVYERKFGA